MKVFIADKIPEKSITELENLGLSVKYQPSANSTVLDSGLVDVSILIVRSTVVSKKCINNSPNLVLIIRAGAGVNNIDLEVASKSGIYVANCPGKDSVAVAELTMGLILSLDRRIAENVLDFRKGIWNKADYSNADGIYGKILGIIGVGRIGQEVIKRAKVFGIQIIAWSRSLSQELADELDITYAETMEEVAAKCDILSVHLALKPETKKIISKEILIKLRDGALFINTSRAEVVDEDALFTQVKMGRIRVGLDVLDDEPEQKQGAIESRFRELEGVYITHHIGASTNQAQLAVASNVTEIVRVYLKEGKVLNWVNRCDHTKARWKLVVRHYDKPGVIANVMMELKKVNINAQELENVIFEGKEAACCTIQLDSEPTNQLLSDIRIRQDEIISATLISANN